MSRFYQNLLFASIFLLGHLLSPAMSLWVPGSTCPKGKAMVCCYGTPFVCFAWTWPCDENEVEKCCEKTDVCLPSFIALPNASKRGITSNQGAQFPLFWFILQLSPLFVVILRSSSKFQTNCDTECSYRCLRKLPGPYSTRGANGASSWHTRTSIKTRSGFQYRLRHWWFHRPYTTSFWINLDRLDRTHSFSAIEGSIGLLRQPG